MRRLHSAGVLDRVLLPQLRQHLVHVQPQLGQPLLRDLDEQLFVLRAEQLHLCHIGHAQQLLAHIVGKLLDLGITETVGLQRIDHAVDIPEVVIEKRSLHALRQGKPHIADLLANGIPDARHLAGFGRILDLKNDLRFAGLGIAANLVRVGHLLQRALDLVSDLLSDLLRRGARPVRAHHHRPKSKRRVFVLPELKIGRKAQQQQHDHQITCQRRVLQRPLGEVKPLFGLNLGHGGPQRVDEAAADAAGDAALPAAEAGAPPGIATETGAADPLFTCATGTFDS